MYAMLKSGSLQFKAVKDGVIRVPRLNKQTGDTVEFNEVMLLSTEAGVTIGTPTIAGAKVLAEVVKEDRDRKVIIYKFKHRKGYHRKKGHRQWQTEVRIKDFVLPA